ncbi:hypothetical protein EVAR_9561_1 [Eumeta japonica]|uniref:Uncharacterized protein n=1 Tax=Eumeta variegata TaxID=151549 RepID=A0A4C1U404_EUMVA|nr:hypothetical protein EVAR_9561_1 [Eumeta japonica]
MPARPVQSPITQPPVNHEEESGGLYYRFAPKVRPNLSCGMRQRRSAACARRAGAANWSDNGRVDGTTARLRTIPQPRDLGDQNVLRDKEYFGLTALNKKSCPKMLYGHDRVEMTITGTVLTMREFLMLKLYK